MIEDTRNKVIHDRKNQRFILTIKDDEVQTKYRYIDDKTIEIYSTYAPVELRDQGRAATEVNEALNYAEENNLEVIPTCWYVKKLILEKES